MQCLNAWKWIFCNDEGLPTAHCFRGGIFFHTTLTAGLRRKHSRSEVNATPLKIKINEALTQRSFYLSDGMLFQYVFSTLCLNKAGTQSIQNAEQQKIGKLPHTYLVPKDSAQPKYRKINPWLLLPTRPGLPALVRDVSQPLEISTVLHGRVNFTAPALLRQEIIFNNLSGLTFWYSIIFSRFKALYKGAKVHLY